MFPHTQQVKSSLWVYFAFVTEGAGPTPVGSLAALDLRGVS